MLDKISLPIHIGKRMATSHLDNILSGILHDMLFLLLTLQTILQSGRRCLHDLKNGKKD